EFSRTGLLPPAAQYRARHAHEGQLARRGIAAHGRRRIGAAARRGRHRLAPGLIAWRPSALLASPWFATLAPLLPQLPAMHFPAVDALSALAAQRGVASGGDAPLRF